MPPPSPTDLSARLDVLLANRIQHLVPRTARDILDCIDQAVQRWLDPDSPERQEAEARLPETTGLSAAMIRHVLPLIFQEYRADKLEALCVDELGCLEVLDRFCPVCLRTKARLWSTADYARPGRQRTRSRTRQRHFLSAGEIRHSWSKPRPQSPYCPSCSLVRFRTSTQTWAPVSASFPGLGETQSLRTWCMDGRTLLLPPARMRASRQSGNERAERSSATGTK